MHSHQKALPESSVSLAVQRSHGTLLAGFILMLLSVATTGLAVFGFVHFHHQASYSLARFGLDMGIVILSVVSQQFMAKLGLARALNPEYSIIKLFRPDINTLQIMLGLLMNLVLFLIYGFFILFVCAILFLITHSHVLTVIIGVVFMIPIFILYWVNTSFISFAIQNKDARFYNAWFIVIKHAKTYHIKTIGYVILASLFSLIGSLLLFIGLIWSLPISANLLAIVYLRGKESKIDLKA